MRRGLGHGCVREGGGEFGGGREGEGGGVWRGEGGGGLAWRGGLAGEGGGGRGGLAGEGGGVWRGEGGFGGGREGRGSRRDPLPRMASDLKGAKENFSPEKSH